MSREPRYLDNDLSVRGVFHQCFDLRPFVFAHSLSSHPLFAIPALRELAAKLTLRRDGSGFFRISNDSQGLTWGCPELQRAVDEALENIETSRLRLKLSSVHSEPDYRDVLDQCTEELSDLTGVDLARLYKDAVATIFISSPYELTPYHIDQEANFLLEIQGSKTVYIMDGDNREVLPWNDLEEYWQGRGDVRLPEGLESRAACFDLGPGVGVHNPVNFPHWVHNGASPSVALSLGYTRLRDPVDVLRLNFYLRKLHLSPSPPGSSALRDRAKLGLVECARRLRRTLGSTPG